MVYAIFVEVLYKRMLLLSELIESIVLYERDAAEDSGFTYFLILTNLSSKGV